MGTYVFSGYIRMRLAKCQTKKQVWKLPALQKYCDNLTFRGPFGPEEMRFENVRTSKLFLLISL